jgi:hypothetical protein
LAYFKFLCYCKCKILNPHLQNVRNPYPLLIFIFMPLRCCGSFATNIK